MTSIFSREQLSQLLLVFIGTGADILEFISETIEEDSKSACSLNLHFVIWIVWAWSLFQFTLVLTASAGRKPRGAGASGAWERLDLDRQRGPLDPRIEMLGDRQGPWLASFEEDFEKEEEKR